MGISFRMASEPKDERLNLSVSRSLLKAIDDWRRQQEDIPTRTGAARRLIEIGLAAQPRKAAGKP